MDKNVLVPLSLLTQIIDLLDYWDLSEYDPVICCNYENILRVLNEKLHKLELRNAYAKIISADSSDERHDARIRYLQQKDRLREEPPF